jgi:beta-N-acetylhexosaminidase
MTIGATGSSDFAYEVNKATAETLIHFGINMNYAPVSDINSEPLNPVIGVRSPGDDPELVGRFASASARGMRELGVVPSIKHFPGHGDTAVDSHVGLPVINKTREQLEACELVPFRRAVAEGIETVMTAHIALPALTGDPKLPVTLSPEALGILRNEWQYDGVIITDCLEMDGVRATYGSVDGSVMSIKAGSDSVMMCHTYEIQKAAIDRVCQAVGQGEITPERLEQSSQRLKNLKSRFLTWNQALKVTTHESLARLNEKNAALAQKVYAESTTVVRASSGLLPLSSAAKTVFLSPGGAIPAGGAVDSGEEPTRVPWTKATFIDVLRNHTNSSVQDIRYTEGGLSAEVWEAIDDAEVIILATRNAREAAYQKKLGLEIGRRRRPNLVVIATCNPYDFLEDIEEIPTYLAIYEPTIEAFTSAIRVLYGKLPATGKLPVAFKGSASSTGPTVSVVPFTCSSDIAETTQVWNSTLAEYPLHESRLRLLLNQANGHHFIARSAEGGKIIGFCFSFTSTTGEGKTRAFISSLAVLPAYQSQGVGTALLATTRNYLRQHHQVITASLASSFPRFWPGIPTDISRQSRNFFIHRGARIRPITQKTDADLYINLTKFEQATAQKYIDRASSSGFVFRVLQTQEEYEDCLVGQEKNFGDNRDWVQSFVSLPPSTHPSSVLIAFDTKTTPHKQVGWTLMLSPDNELLHRWWAFSPPSTDAPVSECTTGLIGCVGVDTEYRKEGVGLAMVCHAVMQLRDHGGGFGERGAIGGIFVDWTDLVDWYGKVGFEVWRTYSYGEI